MLNDVQQNWCNSSLTFMKIVKNDCYWCIIERVWHVLYSIFHFIWAFYYDRYGIVQCANIHRKYLQNISSWIFSHMYIIASKDFTHEQNNVMDKNKCVYSLYKMDPYVSDPLVCVQLNLPCCQFFSHQIHWLHKAMMESFLALEFRYTDVHTASTFTRNN